MPSSSKPTKRPQGKGPRLLVGVALGVALAGLLVSGLAFVLLPREQDVIGEAKSATNRVAWPDYVASAPLAVRQAYQFALENPGVLSFIPCYCGCNSAGHTSNEHCFIRSRGSSGVVFDRHGSGWDICVDIARDAMGMMADGKSLREARAYIEAKYSHFGPGTTTPLPPF